MRLIGALLLAAALASYFLGGFSRERRALCETKGFLLFLRHIRAEIAGASAPLPNIIARFDNEDLQKCGFLTAAKEKGLAAALEGSKKALALPERLYNELLSYFAAFGKSFRAEELLRCDAAIAALDAAKADMEKELPKKRRLSRAYALTGSLFLLLIFL